VSGDLEKEFTNLLVYGTGLGPMGITKGCFVINKFGGAEVKVSEHACAARCLGFVFKTEELRDKAVHIIDEFLPELKPEMNTQMSDVGGRVGPAEYVQVECHQGFLLYVDFTADFENFRGHGGISRAVGFAKREIEKRLQKGKVKPDLCVIAQGYDGDLKPSPRNKRGRYASAQIRVPVHKFQELLKINAGEFISFVDLDRTGSQKLGCPFYSGMGGEIIPALYRATKVNPRSCLVSSFQNIYARVDGEDLIYGVELPNVEAGVLSTHEGLIPPVGREALEMIGIQTARDFAACMAAQVLAGEFNLAVEIVRERLYDS
jgi:hydroxymethylglutaryl-CoA reductase